MNKKLMIGLGILTLVLIILAFFILRPKPDSEFSVFLTTALLNTCFTVNGKKAKVDIKKNIVTIGDTTYPVIVKTPKSFEDPTPIIINNEGEYNISLTDDPKGPEGNKIFKIDTISGPFVFTNC
jgi:hypothetical protein